MSFVFARAEVFAPGGNYLIIPTTYRCLGSSCRARLTGLEPRQQRHIKERARESIPRPPLASANPRFGRTRNSPGLALDARLSLRSGQSPNARTFATFLKAQSYDCSPIRCGRSVRWRDQPTLPALKRSDAEACRLLKPRRDLPCPRPPCRCPCPSGTHRA
jgi:hypothetical protein